MALRTIGDREEAADAVQDALLSAHRAAARFRGDSAVTTWLHRIVVNACLDRIRRRQAHPTVPLPDGNRAPTTGTGGLGAGGTGAGPRHRAGGPRRRSPRCRLEQRAALVLVDVQGYPVAEVAGSSASPRARSRAGAPGAGPGWPCCSGTCAPPASGRLRPRPPVSRPIDGRARRHAGEPRPGRGRRIGVGPVPAGRQPGGHVTTEGFREVDLDLLADYLGGALDGTPEQDEVAHWSPTDPPGPRRTRCWPPP